MKNKKSNKDLKEEPMDTEQHVSKSNKELNPILYSFRVKPVTIKNSRQILKVSNILFETFSLYKSLLKRLRFIILHLYVVAH